jgi:GTPase SAR1 family protein
MGNSGPNPKNDALILGLEKSGKTTLFESLTWKQGTSMDDNEKTLGFNYEYWEFRGEKLGLWDVGGGDLARKLWRTMY